MTPDDFPRSFDDNLTASDEIPSDQQEPAGESLWAGGALNSAFDEQLGLDDAIPFSSEPSQPQASDGGDSWDGDFDHDIPF